MDCQPKQKRTIEETLEVIRNAPNKRFCVSLEEFRQLKKAIFGEEEQPFHGVSWDDLPNDIQKQIFGLFTEPEDYRKVCSICKKWKNMISDEEERFKLAVEQRNGRYITFLYLCYLLFEGCIKSISWDIEVRMLGRFVDQTITITYDKGNFVAVIDPVEETYRFTIDQQIETLERLGLKNLFGFTTIKKFFRDNVNTYDVENWSFHKTKRTNFMTIEESDVGLSVHTTDPVLCKLADTSREGRVYCMDVHDLLDHNSIARNLVYRFLRPYNVGFRFW